MIYTCVYIYILQNTYIYIYIYVQVLWNQHPGNQGQKNKDERRQLSQFNLEAGLLIVGLRLNCDPIFGPDLALFWGVAKHKQELLNTDSEDTCAGTCASANASWHPRMSMILYIYIIMHSIYNVYTILYNVYTMYIQCIYNVYTMYIRNIPIVAQYSQVKRMSLEFGAAKECGSKESISNLRTSDMTCDRFGGMDPTPIIPQIPSDLDPKRHKKSLWGWNRLNRFNRPIFTIIMDSIDSIDQ